MATGSPLIYLILGASGSGRREILLDLIGAGLAEGDTPAVLLSANEASSAADASLPRLSRWEWRDDAISADLPKGATHVFFIVDGALSPVDQIESFKAWLDVRGAQLGRVLCVVNCQLVARHRALLAWFDACVHFSDVVLLNRREGLENKWLSDFLNHYKKQYVPCLFETVKAGRVHNPALILEPQARRLSQVFDEEQDWVFTNAEGETIDEEDDESSVEDGEEVDAAPMEDPYFARRNGGRRIKELPDITAILRTPPAA